MKKPFFAVCLFIAVSFCIWGQSFNLPPVTNNVESIKNAFLAFVENTRNLGIVEHGSDWTSSQESITRHYREYLDDVLANMTYGKVNSYVAAIRANIDRLDRQAISKNAELEFERFLTAAYPNYEYELAYSINQPFPASITLDYNNSQIENFDSQVRRQEELLTGYRSRLESLPALGILQSQLRNIQDEMKKPENQRNSQRLQQLRNNETSVMNQIANNNGTRVNLTDNIRRIETYLREAGSNRARLIADLEKQEKESYIRTLYENIYNFYSWEAFFRGENTIARDFLAVRNVKQELNDLLDELPQGQAQIYRTKLDAFCSGWGL
jgi:hypothetical protein